MKNILIICIAVALSACSKPSKRQIMIVSKVEANSNYGDSTSHCGCTGAYGQKYMFTIDNMTMQFYTDLEIKPADTIEMLPTRLLRELEAKGAITAKIEADTTIREIKYW